MQTETIKNIATAVENVEGSLDSFVVRDHADSTFGHENEYTAQILKAGIKALLSDIRSLLKAHNKFVRLSIYEERDEIFRHLSDMHSYLEQANYSQVAIILDAIKIKIRAYGVRGSKESQEVVTENINKLIGMVSKLEEELNEAQRIKSNADNILQNAQEAEKKIEDVVARVDAVNEKSGEAENADIKIAEHNENIEKISANITSKEELINSFAGRIVGLQQQVDAQKKSTTNYNEKLEEYTQKYNENINDAELLIEKARDALEYTTAYGISAAFDERYKGDKKLKAWLWVLVAGVFVVGAIAIGILLLDSVGTISMPLVISRIAVMSAAISGAWFCAGQYVKHKNTMEDYGYKAVLSKSMMAFLEQLKGDERERYLELVLTEIHKDPLRKRHEIHDGMGQGAVHKLEKEAKKLFKKDPVNVVDKPSEP